MPSSAAAQSSHRFSSQDLAQLRVAGEKKYREIGLAPRLGENGKEKNLFDVLAGLAGVQRVELFLGKPTNPIGYLTALNGAYRAAIATGAGEKERAQIDLEEAVVRYYSGERRGSKAAAHAFATALAHAYSFADEQVMGGWNAPKWIPELQKIIPSGARRGLDDIWQVAQGRHQRAAALRENMIADGVGATSEAVGI